MVIAMIYRNDHITFFMAEINIRMRLSNQLQRKLPINNWLQDPIIYKIA